MAFWPLLWVDSFERLPFLRRGLSTAGGGVVAGLGSMVASSVAGYQSEGASRRGRRGRRDVEGVGTGDGVSGQQVVTK